MTVLESLHAERAKYGPRIRAAEAIAILNAVAWRFRLNYGLLEAPSGGNGGIHPHGFVRCDILADKSERRIFDVFRDGPDATQDYAGEAEVVWQDKGPLDESRFVAPANPDIAAPPVPSPEPPEAPAPPLPPEAPTPPGVPEFMFELLEELERLVAVVGILAGHAKRLADHVETAQKTGVKIRL